MDFLLCAQAARQEGQKCLLNPSQGQAVMGVFILPKKKRMY